MLSKKSVIARSIAGLLAAIILLQIFIVSNFSVGASPIGNLAGQVSKCEISGSNLVLNGSLSGINQSDIKDINAYALPIFKNEQDINYSLLSPIGTVDLLGTGDTGGSETPVSSNGDMILGDFEGAKNDGWILGDNTGSILSTIKDMASADGQNPAFAAQGGYFLQATKSAAVATTKSYVVKNFAAPLDLGTYKYINYDFYGWAGTSTNYFIDMVLTATDNTAQTFTIQCAPSLWMANNIDISAFAKRSSISSIKFAYYGSDLAVYAGNWTGCFGLDGVNASNSITNPTGSIDPVAAQNISSFETGTGGFEKLTNTNAIGNSSFAGNSKCLEVTKDGVVPTIASSIKKTYAAGAELNLSSYKMFSLDVANWGGAAEKYAYEITLTSSDNKSLKVKKYGEENTWNTLLIDISGFAGRSSISSIEIALSCEGNIVPAAQEGWAGHFFIDNITAYTGVGRLFDFEYGSVNGWTAGDNIYSNYVCSSAGITPYPTIGSHGQNFLMGQKKGSPDTVSSFVKNFSVPLDLSNFSVFAFDFFNHGGGSTTETYQVELVLTSGSSSKTYSSTVSANTWNKLKYGVDDFAGRNSVTQIKINFKALNPVAVSEWNGAFFIDNMNIGGMGVSNIAAPTATTLSDFENGNDEWIAGSDTAPSSVFVDSKGYNWGTESEPNYIPTAASQGVKMLRATKSAVIATTPSYVRKDFATPLNLSKCTQLTYDMFCYGGSSTAYVTNVILTSQSGTVKTYTSNIEHTGWRTISVDISSFDERGSIASIQIGYCGTDTAVTGNAGWAGQFFLDNIIVNGVISSEPVAGVKNGTIDANGNISFNIARSSINDIGKKFVIVITKVNGDTQLVDIGKYVTNPGVLGKNKDAYPVSESIKGLQVQLSSDAQRLGIKHAGINIAMNSLLTMTSHGDSSIPYSYDGKIYYFNKGTIEGLDSSFSGLTSNNILTNAILIMYPTGLNDPDSPNRYIVHPDAVHKAENFIDAINLTNQVGVDYYSVMVKFLAERYNGNNKQYGRINGYIVGNEIGAECWNSMGEKPIDEYIKQYERQLRLTNTIVKQAWSNARVYVSLDHFWGMKGFTYNNKQIIDLINQNSKAGGDYDWNVAFHPYPEDLNDTRTWNDKTATDSFSSGRITFKNLQVLPRYLKQATYLYNGASRRIILSEQGFNTRDNTQYQQNLQAAAYAYAYYKAASIPEIDAFLLHRHVDNTGEFGLNLGMWTTVAGEVSQAGTQKKIYNVFKNIDTVDSLNVSNFALGVIGSDTKTTLTSWNQIIPEFNLANINAALNRPTLQTGVSGMPINASNVEVISSGTADKWVANDNTSKMVIVNDTDISKNVLTVAVNGFNFKDYKGLTYTPTTPLNLTNKPILMVNVKATNIGAGKKAEYMIRAYSGDKVIEGSYITDGNVWNTVSLDLTDFSGISSVDKIKVWVRPMEDKSWNAGIISIDNLAISSTTSVQNIMIKTNVQKVTKVGDVVQITLTNKGNRVVEENAAIVGLNGLKTDIGTKALNIGIGRSVTFSVTITSLSVPLSKAGIISIVIGGQTYLLTLTDIVYPEYIMDGNDIILGDFENAMTDGWIAGNSTMNVQSVTSGSEQNSFPRKAQHGTYCLEGRKTSVIATTPSYFTRNFKKPLDLSGFSKIDFGFFGWAGTSVNYTVDLLLTAADGSTQSYSSWYPGDNEWHTYSIDITDFTGRNNLKSISIAYYGADNYLFTGTWNGFFYIDNVRGISGTGTGPIDPGPNPNDPEIGSAYTKLTDNATNISVTGLSILSDLALVVTPITDRTSDLFMDAEKKLLGLENVSIANLYEISLTQDGEKIEPNGRITITLPLPAEYDRNTLYVIAHYRNDGSLTYIVPKESNGMLVFETDSLSQFAVLSAGNKAVGVANPPTGEEKSFTLLLFFIVILSASVLILFKGKRAVVAKN